jgi:ketosteroid isomerase-like protein
MSDANRETAVRLLKSVVTGRPDFDAVAPDAVWWVTGQPETPLRAFVNGLNEKFVFPGRLEVLGVTAERDRVAVEAESFLDTKIGRPYNNRYHFLVEFRGGQVVRVKEYCNTAYVNAVFSGDFFKG